MDVATVFGIAVAAGLVGALTGLGGGAVLIPALTLLGLDIRHAIAVSVVAVVATSSGAAAAYVRDRITHVKTGMFLELFTINGAMAGAAIMLLSGRRLLFVLFGTVLIGSAAALFRRRQGGGGRAPDRLSAWLELSGRYYDLATGRTVAYAGRRAALGGPLMFGAGVIAGMLGIGAGALKVLVLDLVMGYPPKVSTTTSNMIIGVTALAGAGVYLAAGLIDPGLAAPVALGVVLGALGGTRLLVRLRNRTVRSLFMGILLALGLEMIGRGLGVVG